MTINEAMFFTWVMVFFACAVIWEILKFVFRAIFYYLAHTCGVYDKQGRVKAGLKSVESDAIVQQAKQNRDALFGQELPPKYTIEHHGFEGAYVLYFGRDMHHHGANLCTLSEFDARGEETRKRIVDALNAEKTP